MGERSAEARPAPARGARSSVATRAAALLAQALAGDDAEATGLRAGDVLADPGQATSLLGGPHAMVAARHAVVQRFGRLGALLVVAYEERWRRGQMPSAARARRSARDRAAGALLESLIAGFCEYDATRLEELLAELDEAEGMPILGADIEARRRLHATYAVAARDGTDSSHRAYMVALDRVMRLAAPRIAS